MKYTSLTSIILTITFLTHGGRSVFRSLEPNLPTLTVCFENNALSTCMLQESHLEQWPLFHTFDHDNFMANMLPEGPINFRYDPQQTITGKKLGELIMTALEEIKQNKKNFSHFTVLKKKDFRDTVGLIILKFNDYPFVAKIFIETPDSLTTSWEKGFESTCFFFMGGGMNRHLAGFTRIKNLHNLRTDIVHHPYWKDRVQFPRKWFWTPPQVSWLELRGSNIGNGNAYAKIPSVYVIVADYINIKKTFTLKSMHDRRTAFALSSFFESAIDSHINNFVEEQGTGNIVILDTEHFPTMVGMRYKPKSKSYLQWYTHLSTKMLHDLFGRHKLKRKQIQLAGPSQMHIALQDKKKEALSR